MAARHYSVPHFFRQVPNPLLKRYFASHDLFGDVDFEKMLETKPDALLKAWDALSDERRTAIEPQLREIFDLASGKGFHAIRDEAQWQLGENPAEFATFFERLAAMSSHFERAMTTFLDHHGYWRGAVRFCHADSLSYWRKRHGLPAKAAAIDPPSRAALETEIGLWFRKAEGRGRNCRVELLRRDQRDYFFVFPEDFANESIEWVGKDLGRRSRNPAFEVVFVWSASDGSLDFNYRGTPKAKDALQAIFARNVLKLDKLPPDGDDEPIYDLNPLKRREFQFVYAADSGVESVRLRKLRLASTVRDGDRITLEADAASNRLALYDVIEQAGRAFPLDLWNVTQAEIVVQLAARDDKPARREAFSVGYPNSCSLKYDEIGLKLRAMLVDSRIEKQ
jgi:hypothetical protein